MTHRVLTTVRLADGTTSQHVSQPMSEETARAWVAESERSGAGRATSTVITNPAYAAMLADRAGCSS